ncbi:ATP-binding protein [Couchioplanes azureus]|uniref:ATP-binding protein n=1 Tax=Couchioplanes caeruleus TaxID=56438 RepID=UPI0016708ED0|nr:ATP-binding protein [Couchioplanes caeruleus]GGQ73249.1 hypothetical protein GCM10010166_49100 [Couchioplanes caeruleus subsp. azureus]
MSSWPDPGSAEPVEHVFSASPATLRDIRSYVTRLGQAAGVTDGDLERIVLVANEVATNAVEHSGADAVTVRWEPTGHGVWITVVDDGVFALGVSATGHRGVGLRLVLGLADEVTVRAGRRGEHGTTVRLHMPVHSAQVPGRPRLLVVDGDRFAGRSLSLFLQAEGYPTTLAASAQAGRAAPGGPPRLAIVDLTSSQGATTALCEELTRSRIPVLALSSLPPPATLPADRFLRKPVHPLEVLAAVRQLIEPVDAAAGTAAHA